MTAPIDIEVLKDDLGITDTASDAWLTRRVEAIWSRIESYTARTLRAPPATFRDEWSGFPWWTPGSLWPLVNPSNVFLRQYPVTEILTIDAGDDEVDIAGFSLDKRTGQVIALNGVPWPTTGIVSIAYKAGWEDLPAELYDVVLSLMRPLWAERSAATSGTLAGVNSISINDVGSVDLTTSTAYSDVAAKSGGDPMLGPYAYVLDSYIDWRARMGGQPGVTSELIEEYGS